jgi:hypothetical protein
MLPNGSISEQTECALYMLHYMMTSAYIAEQNQAYHEVNLLVAAV